MSLHIPNKELFHNTVVASTKATVETAIQTMVDTVDKKRTLQALDQLIDQLGNFRRHYAGTPDQEQQVQVTPRRDTRQQRNN